MKAKSALSKPIHYGLVVLALGAVIGVALWWSGARQPVKAQSPEIAPAPARQAAASSVSNTTTAPGPGPVQSLAGSGNRAFPVTHESAGYQWTAEDGKNLEVIRRLAHNELEYQRMLEENSRILRRQLVYCKDTADIVARQSRSSGRSLRQLVLPGLDGNEIHFEINAADLSPSGQQGTFSGRVAGRPDSMITLAFKGGREAFTVMSPADGLFLQGDPRDPGEIIVKSIDPATYVPGVCGTP